MRQQQTRGGAIDTALLELGVGNEASLLELLGEVSGYRPVNLADFEPNSDVATFIPPKIADRLCVVPLSLDGNSLHVACGYPVPRKELDEVGFLLGKPLELWVATELRVREWISAVYKQPLSPRFAQLMASLNNRPASAAPAPPPPPAEAMDEEAALTASMVERLARSVASEPLPLDAKKTPPLGSPSLPPSVAAAMPPPAQPPPPAYTREPLRLNMPANPGATPAPTPRAPANPAAAAP
ncbi:GspE/PulE/PilB domain-containing protein, partial [Stigmatella hybrida]